MQYQPVIKISDKVRLELNNLLGELDNVKTEAEKQQQAQVPQMDAVIQTCDTCIEQIKAFKAVNFPNKK